MSTTVETDSPPDVETITVGRTTAPRYMTLEEFENFAWGEEKVELVRGEVRFAEGACVSPFAAGAHTIIVHNILFALHAHVAPRHLGRVYGDGTGYTLPGLPDTARGPDVSFVRAGLLPDLMPIQGAFRVAPDLAVEVISPSESWSDTEEKIEDLFAAGTAVVWIVSPRRRRVTVRTPSGIPRVLEESEVLDGAPVLPDFAMPLTDVFAGVAPESRRR